MEEEIKIDIRSLHEDDKNFNKGTEHGQEIIDKSFAELGAGRSILLDKDNNIIAGNKSTQSAIAAGIQKVRVIETNGDELVVVRRVDLDINSGRARRMALLDNLSASKNINWDKNMIDDVSYEYELDSSEWTAGLLDIGTLDNPPTKKIKETTLTFSFNFAEFNFVVNKLRLLGENLSLSLLKSLQIDERT